MRDEVLGVLQFNDLHLRSWRGGATVVEAREGCVEGFGGGGTREGGGESSRGG